MGLSAEEQTAMFEMTKSTNAEVARLAVAIRDETNGLGAQVAALRRELEAIKAKLERG
jgi:hypothetical protein